MLDPLLSSLSLRPHGLPELTEIESLIAEGGSLLAARVLCQVQMKGVSYPVHAITLGNPSPKVPAIGFFGGVHGLERIGAEVVIAYLRTLVKRLAWDRLLHQQLKSVRLVFMPLVNPGGLMLGTRANPRGVDLMRNAPVDAVEPVPFLIGGQRLSPGLPWFRGFEGAPMEQESAALCALVEEELLSRRFSLAIDCHSGFGTQDRIWFPPSRICPSCTHCKASLRRPMCIISTCSSRRACSTSRMAISGITSICSRSAPIRVAPSCR